MRRRVRQFDEVVEQDEVDRRAGREDRLDGLDPGLEQALPDTISLNLADIEQTISFRTRAEQILDLKIFD